MAQPTTLLLTRPFGVSQGFAEQVAQEIGPIPTVIAPLLNIEFLDFPTPDRDCTVVFTSRNGVAAWARAKLPVDHPCYCVGHATGEAARALGFNPIVSGGTVAHLLSDITESAPQGRLLHVHGRHTRGDLVGALRAHGFDVGGALAYEQTPMELNSDARQLLQGGAPVIVPLFSPRSAAQFAQAGPFGSQVDIIAISQTAAEQFSNARIAPSPDAKGMIAAILQGAIGSSST